MGFVGKPALTSLRECRGTSTPLRRLPLTNLAFRCHPSISCQILCCQSMRFTALVHSLLQYHTADIAWLASLGTSYLLRNSIEVLLYSECDKILMVHLRSIINDEYSIPLQPQEPPSPSPVSSASPSPSPSPSIYDPPARELLRCST